jgi:class 3 adenylate cyclase
MGATSADAPSARFEERTLVLVLTDLAGFVRAVAGLPALEIASVVDAFYELCGEQVARHGGRVVKCSGDNCLAAFDADDAVAAVEYALAVRGAVHELGRRLDLDLEVGTNVHRAPVVVGRFGGAAFASDDVIGKGVMHTYRMGAGPGVRISEPVYRALPSLRRSQWHKYQPPATYTFEQ